MDDQQKATEFQQRIDNGETIEPKDWMPERIANSSSG
jgi:ring-1,2-phenylacetyl-CoA epoxidase subunit PaaA